MTATKSEADLNIFLENCYQIRSASPDIDIDTARAKHAELTQYITPVTVQDFWIVQFYSSATYILAKRIAQEQHDNLAALQLLMDAATTLSTFVDTRIQCYGEIAFNLAHAVIVTRQENHTTPEAQQLIEDAARKATELLHHLFDRHNTAFKTLTAPHFQEITYFCLVGNAYTNLDTNSAAHQDKKILFYLLSSCQEILMLLAEVTKTNSPFSRYFTDERINDSLNSMDVPVKMMDFKKYQQGIAILPSPLIQFERQELLTASDVPEEVQQLQFMQTALNLGNVVGRGVHHLWLKATDKVDPGYTPIATLAADDDAESFINDSKGNHQSMGSSW